MSTRRGRTPAFGRTARLIVGALAVAAVVTTSALAGTIVGTAKNDTIRGTAGADKLYGRQGNDSLFGMAGGGLPERWPRQGPVLLRGRSRHGRRRAGARASPATARSCAGSAGRRRHRRRRRRHRRHLHRHPAATTAASSGSARQGRVLRRLREHGRQRQLRRRGRRAKPVQFKFSYEADCQPPGRLTAGTHLRRNGPDRGRRHVLREREHGVGHHGEVQRDLRRGRHDGVGAIPGACPLRPGRGALRVRLGRGGLVGQVAGLT